MNSYDGMSPGPTFQMTRGREGEDVFFSFFCLFGADDDGVQPWFALSMNTTDRLQFIFTVLILGHRLTAGQRI